MLNVSGMRHVCNNVCMESPVSELTHFVDNTCNSKCYMRKKPFQDLLLLENNQLQSGHRATALSHYAAAAHFSKSFIPSSFCILFHKPSDRSSYFLLHVTLKVQTVSWRHPPGCTIFLHEHQLLSPEKSRTSHKPDPYLMVGPRRDLSEETDTVLLLSCACSPLSARGPALPGELALLSFRCGPPAGVSLAGFMRPPPPFSPALFRFEFITKSGQSDCLFKIGFVIIIILLGFIFIYFFYRVSAMQYTTLSTHSEFR